MASRLPPAAQEAVGPPLLPFDFFHARLPRLTPACPRAPPPSADTLSRSEHLSPPLPLDEFDRHATVSPVSGEDRRSARIPPPLSAQLTPRLTLPLIDLTSCPPPSERRRAGLSSQPHRRLTSSVSRVVTHLARRTPPTALVLLPSTPQQGSRR
jgi:hypothetical protein